jgi:hypothetical protein
MTKKATQIPTIDVSLVTIKSGTQEFGLETADKIKVKPEIETEKAVKLIVKGVLLSQKRATNTLTGHTITLSDNVFIPEIVKIIQGGTITYKPTLIAGTTNALAITPLQVDSPVTIELIQPTTASTVESILVTGKDITIHLATDSSSAPSSTLSEIKAILDASSDAKALISTAIVGTGSTIITASVPKTTLGTEVGGYTPPVAGQKLDLPVFELCAYSAIYDGSGLIKGYEKVVYPNCTGEPMELDSEDGKFRAPEYTISSAPEDGQAPYQLSYIDKEDLPVLI